jgi:hypothetical protein
LVKPVKVDDLTDTPDWKKKLAQALADAKAGRGTLYLNEDEFMAALANKFKPKRKKSK